MKLEELNLVTKVIKLNKVKPNPDNPRFIRDTEYEKLVKSITESSWMLFLRPIIVNDDMTVLGGNMRLRACKEAGLKEAPVVKASELTAKQQREFIIKDNVSFGEWNYDTLANEWHEDETDDWGLTLPIDFNQDEFENDIQGDESGNTKTLDSVKFKKYMIYITKEEEDLFQKAIDKHLLEYGVLTGLINNILGE